ncbi:MAG: AsnC family transcriptional regulator [Sphingobium sp.]|uniref:AsnC family transcriptional regulator n=1 Tax=Sphingobium sp. TaxID=1912891 RepID=UPI0029AF344E|nr:AsnC family transcriptional regulator [Sphingobium sp.]MDX3910204.1 AsnC family transcriptional regulator [Sphingobium sp.]
MPAELDPIDRKILTLMQKDASLTAAQIARRERPLPLDQDQGRMSEFHSQP